MKMKMRKNYRKAKPMVVATSQAKKILKKSIGAN
jgi:hypothetical protein